APATLGVCLVAVLLVGLVLLWRRTLAQDKRFHAPLLVTSVLIMGDAGFSILESHHSPILKSLTGGVITSYSPTFVCIFVTMLGMTVMLFLAPHHVAGLSVEAGNTLIAPLVIWLLGGMILYQLGRLHIPVAFVLAYVLMAYSRHFVTGQPWQAEMAPITSPM